MGVTEPPGAAGSGGGTIRRAVAPDGTQITLHHRHGHFRLRADGRELMDSRHAETERALASIGLSWVRRARPWRVLIGGLGMGFTLRGALDALDAGSRVLVVESVAAVIEWNRGALGSVAGRPLDDPRVRVACADVRRVLEAAAPAALDAILLDVDNGPSDLSQSANADLYAHPGLAAARRALHPSGALAIWSAASAPDLVARLRAHGFAAEAHRALPAANRASIAHEILVAGPLPGTFRP